MIYIATDHAGFETKNAIVEFLKSSGIECEDIGPFEYDSQDDYPDFIIPCAEKVALNPEVHKWIILGGSGQGEAIAANKVAGIRAAVYYGSENDIVSLSRIHNDANILSLGERFLSTQEALDTIQYWLDTDYKHEERHQRRIDKISKYEKERT
jgi:ribose 5-phosphate isomerase B